MDKTDGNRQNSYIEAMKAKPGGGKGHVNPYQWKPKKAHKRVPGEQKNRNV